MNTINYGNLAVATKGYEAIGFKPIEVPWRATMDILNITKPPGVDRKDFIIAGTEKGLLASGEQGFLYLANKGALPPGLYQTVTPCFRNEAHDRYHSKQFMKLELIELMNLQDAKYLIDAKLIQENVRTMAENCKLAMQRIAPEPLRDYIKIFTITDAKDPIAMPGSLQLDVVLDLDGNEIELGSYGARMTTFAAWVYGTGIAEPRFSRAIAEGQAYL